MPFPCRSRDRGCREKYKERAAGNAHEKWCSSRGRFNAKASAAKGRKAHSSGDNQLSINQPPPPPHGASRICTGTTLQCDLNAPPCAIGLTWNVARQHRYAIERLLPLSRQLNQTGSLDAAELERPIQHNCCLGRQSTFCFAQPTCSWRFPLFSAHHPIPSMPITIHPIASLHHQPATLSRRPYLRASTRYSSQHLQSRRWNAHGRPG